MIKGIMKLRCKTKHPILEEIKKSLRTIARYYGCNIRFTNDSKNEGKWDVYSRRINVPTFCFRNSQFQTENIISTFFHEIAHQWNYDNNKFPIYHSKIILKKNIRALKSTAWRAEVYTDKIGRDLMKIYFPTLKYYPSYGGIEDTPKARKDFKEWVDSWIGTFEN